MSGSIVFLILFLRLPSKRVQNRPSGWATKIAERYMGRRNAEAYGKRNSGEGAVLIQINPTRIIAEKDIAAWD
jgi:hypothetical protein